MQKFLKYSTDLINIIMITLLSFIATWYLYVLLQFNISPLILVCYFCLLLITYSFRLLIKNLIIYLLAHVGLLFSLILLPILLPIKVTITLFFIILFISSMNYWLRNSIEFLLVPPISFALIFIIPLLHATSDKLQHTSYLFAFLYVGIYLLRVFLTNIFHFFQDSIGASYTPYKYIFKHNALYVITTILFLVLIPYFTQLQVLSNGVKQFFYFIFAELKRFLRFVFSLLPYESTFPTPEPLKNNASQGPLPPPKDPSPFLSFLYSFLWYVVQFVVVIGFFSLIAYLTYFFFKQYMYRKTSIPIAKDTSSVIEIRESIRQKKKKTSRLFYNNLSPREKIRMQYRKQIINLQKKGYHCDETHTPRERSLDISKNLDTDISQLTTLYESARYSNEKNTTS